MKKNILIVVMSLCTTLLFAQSGTETYKVFIYTNDNLDQRIEQQTKRANFDNRSQILDATEIALKGIGMGYFTSVVDLGINAVGALIVKNSENHIKWKKILEAENKSTISIGTISGVNDFYSKKTFDGAMVPKGMRFDGIGCLRTEGKDTVFYVSCHINNNKIDKIVSNSKFELVLDSLIIDPRHSNVPNNPIYNTPFSFKDRSYLEIGLDIKMISSWVTSGALLQTNQQLGEFKLNFRLTEKDLNPQGVLRYARNEKEPAKYSILGESFIVPRSYAVYRDENGRPRDCWGTGEFKLDVILNESCGISDEYEKAWKKDWKRRKIIENEKNKKGTVINRAWQYVSKQEWDAIAKQWVITTLKAPAKVITEELDKELDIPTTPSSSK